MNGRALYNENDPFAANWLRNLIRAGLIPDGDVDERSIVDVQARDIEGYSHVHFFAGIGGWPHALDLAGWPATREVWTGSCPCQPLSGAGQRKGHVDERHLWPAFYRLIAERRPATIFGEQVESTDGREWLAGIRADLEGLGYAVGCADLCAAGIAAPHRRQRLFWVGFADRHGWQPGEFAAATARYRHPAVAAGSDGRLADAGDTQRRTFDVAGQDGRDRPDDRRQEAHGESRTCGEVRGLADADGGQSGYGGIQPGGQHRQQPQDGGAGGGMGDTCRTRLPASEREAVFLAGRRQEGRTAAEPGGTPRRLADTERAGTDARRFSDGPGEGAGTPEAGPRAESRRCGVHDWGNTWIPCADGKARRIEPGIFPLATGIPGRVGMLRGAGNAIVPQIAAEFIGACLDIERGLT